MDVKDTDKLIKSVDLFIQQTGFLINKYGLEPQDGSISLKELSEIEPNISLKTAYSQGHIFVEVAGDQMMAFIRTMTPPIQTIAPFTNARAVLESCSLAIWMLDNSITALERVCRSFAFRYQGLIEQKKLQSSAQSSNDKAKIENRIEYIIESATQMGIPILREKRTNKINVVGLRIPSTTSLVRKILNKEFDYRLLSSVTHAHHFALQQTSFVKVRNSDDVDLELFKKALSPIFIFYLSDLTVKAFISALKCLIELHNSFNSDYEKIINNISDELKIYREKLEVNNHLP